MSHKSELISSTDKSANPKYRSDVDGLRAIAILSVVIFHAFPNVLSGGFVGVDIFFVISGFLISKLIIQALENNTFGLLGFYARRIKRIFPALILVMVSTLVLGWFTLLADEYRQLGKHVAGGAAFVSNFILWREANYFDTASETKILLHLWSLGVEEQFYIIWPALIWATWKKKFNLLTILIFLTASSFYINIAKLESNATAVFYSPLSRFWELFIGGMLAYLTIFKTQKMLQLEAVISGWLRIVVFRPGYVTERLLVRDVASTLGTVLLITAGCFITKNAKYPGWLALLPTVGTFLILFAGPQSWFNRTILSNRVLVWFGLISYPLYLWHWPLLAFARSMNDGQAPSILIRTTLVLASILLAWLTYRFVEKPIRFGRHAISKITILCISMTCVGAFGYYCYQQNGFGFRLKDRNEYAAYFEGYIYDGTQFIEERHQIAQNQCNRYNWESPWPTIAPRSDIDKQCYIKHTQKSILIWGDSHAAHLYYGLDEILPKDISTLLVFSSGCTPRPVDLSHLQIDHCDFSNNFAFTIAKEQVPEVVILASDSTFDIHYIRELSRSLKQFGVKKIFVLGKVPHWKPYLYKVIIRDYWLYTPKRIQGHQNEDLMAAEQNFRSSMKADEDFEYVDLFNFFCNTYGCMTYVGDNRREGLITFDNHLRPFASVYLAKNLLGPLIMKQFQN